MKFLPSAMLFYAKDAPIHGSDGERTPPYPANVLAAESNDADQLQIVRNPAQMLEISLVRNSRILVVMGSGELCCRGSVICMGMREESLDLTERVGWAESLRVDD